MSKCLTGFVSDVFCVSSYHRWYDYDSMVNRSYQDEQSYHGTAYETETDYGAYSCNQSCCTDTDGLCIVLQSVFF